MLPFILAAKVWISPTGFGRRTFKTPDRSDIEMKVTEALELNLKYKYTIFKFQ